MVSAKAEARRLSTLTVSAIEGALILARVEASARPIEDVAKSLAAALQIRRRRESAALPENGIRCGVMPWTTAQEQLDQAEIEIVSRRPLGFVGIWDQRDSRPPRARLRSSCRSG